MASPKQPPPRALDVINRAKAALPYYYSDTPPTRHCVPRKRPFRRRYSIHSRRIVSYTVRARRGKPSGVFMLIAHVVRKKKRREEAGTEGREQSVLELSRNFSFASELLSLAGSDNPYFSASHFIVARERARSSTLIGASLKADSGASAKHIAAAP